VKPVILALLLVVVAAASGWSEELVFDLRVVDGHLPEDMRRIRVHQNDAVNLRWTVDRPLTLHLHGYDIEKRIAPGPPSVMSFIAYATGRFPVNVHGSAGPGGAAHDETPLTVIEVYPR
jgi:hypothetical protein